MGSLHFEILEETKIVIVIYMVHKASHYDDACGVERTAAQEAAPAVPVLSVFLASCGGGTGDGAGTGGPRRWPWPVADAAAAPPPPSSGGRRLRLRWWRTWTEEWLIPYLCPLQLVAASFSVYIWIFRVCDARTKITAKAQPVRRDNAIIYTLYLAAKPGNGPKSGQHPRQTHQRPGMQPNPPHWPTSVNHWSNLFGRIMLRAKKYIPVAYAIDILINIGFQKGLVGDK